MVKKNFRDACIDGEKIENGFSRAYIFMLHVAFNERRRKKQTSLVCYACDEIVLLNLCEENRKVLSFTQLESIEGCRLASPPLLTIAVSVEDQCILHSRYDYRQFFELKTDQ